MRYEKFRKKYQKDWLVDSCFVAEESGKPVQIVRNQLSRWAKKDLLIPLRRGFYSFPPETDTDAGNLFYAANRLYEPSYISLESALSFYGLIPEKVSMLTSVTTKKTMRFKNPLGRFVYQHVKPRIFRGFKQVEMDRTMVFMAEPEKAVLDFLYLNLGRIRPPFGDQLLSSYRFQNLDALNSGRLREWSRLYQVKKLQRVVLELSCLIREASK